MIQHPPLDAGDLPLEINRTLVRCEGFLDLKLTARAAAELESVPTAFHNHFYFRWLRVQIMTSRQEWTSALPEITRLREAFPAEPGFWIQEAYITRRAVGIEAARDILEQASPRFPDEAVIHFNLGCYACQLGKLEEAKQRIKSAIDLDAKWLAQALDDEDYEPLRDTLEEWSCA